MDSTITRKLKIEDAGDVITGLKPKIRLTGKWLDRAGFKPGNYVQIILKTPGVIEMRSLPTFTTPENERDSKHATF